jgi:hypothetical protein
MLNQSDEKCLLLATMNDQLSGKLTGLIVRSH